MVGFLTEVSKLFGIRILFEYLSRILVFVFVFGWLFETEYIRIRILAIFSNQISFVFVFRWFFKPNIFCIRIRVSFSNRIPLGIFYEYCTYFAEHWSPCTRVTSGESYELEAVCILWLSEGSANLASPCETQNRS